MKKKTEKVLQAGFVCIVGILVVSIGILYYNFISQKIFEDSAEHLKEIYSQVNRSFSAFVEKNWGLLDSWGNYIALMDETQDEAIAGFISEEQRQWKFSGFYFLSEGKASMTPDGAAGTIEFDNLPQGLTDYAQPVMTEEKLTDGKNIILFAVPVERGSYRGFAYDAIAVSYTNADMASSLDVEAFSGNAKCFVIHKDGKVFLSTQAENSIFENYLSYLKGASDLDEASLKKVKNDWENGRTGLLQCKISGVEHCIFYQPIDYQDYMMLSVVPQSVLSAGFLSIQQITMYVFIAIFLLVGIVLIILLVRRDRRLSRENRMGLQSRDVMFNALSNSVNDIFLMLNIEEQRAEYLSPNVERLLGIPVEEAKKNLCVMEKCAINGDVRIPKEELAAIPLDGCIYRECEYIHQATGERRWYRMTVYHVGVQDVSKYIIVMSDRTQERQINKQMEEALDAARSANEAKSNFLSNMSHDIRTPMNAIVGFSVLLEKGAENPEKVREYARKITTSSHHLLSLINDVLDMSKIESGKTSLNVDCFSLPELFEELNVMLMPQVKAKNHNFTVHVQGEMPEKIVGDRLRLNQILINLLTNAIKYTPTGGKIEFMLNVLPQPANALPQGAQQYVRLQFVVRDNGIGMSEEFQKTLFHPFSREINSVTNHIQGTGLGMAITKNLVNLMGGVIDVQSAPGKGSTFTVELSFAVPEPERQGAEPWFRQKITRMLVADDEEEICLDIRELMRESGVEVSYATDGASAVEMAVAAHSKGEDFNVILLDWKMPGLSGVETARQIRRRVHDGIPILVLTSYDWSDIEEEAREAGINAFLSKPFFVSSFWQAIEPLFLDAPESPADETADSPLASLLFLVAEDNALNAEILTAMLDMDGARYEVVENGQEAVDAFLNTEPGHYDMILMDVQMPVMDGYTATRKIRASDRPDAKTIPIIAMTANTFAEDVRNAMEAGMNAHLAKPIHMNTVRDLVARLLKDRE